MFSRKWLLMGLLIGIAVLIISCYIYLYFEKTIYTSDKIGINPPSTKLTRVIPLKENESPHKVYMQINYKSEGNLINGETQLINYDASISYEDGKLIENKSSSLIVNIPKDEKVKRNEKNQQIILFTMNDLPSGNYNLTITIKPNENLNKEIKLTGFTYSVRSHSNPLPSFIPLSGFILCAVSVFLLSRKNNKEIPHSDVNAEIVKG